MNVSASHQIARMECTVSTLWVVINVSAVADDMVPTVSMVSTRYLEKSGLKTLFITYLRSGLVINYFWCGHFLRFCLLFCCCFLFLLLFYVVCRYQQQ